MDWLVAARVFMVDTVLLAEYEREFQKEVDKFHSVCSRRKLRVNAGKSKMMVCERKVTEVVDYRNPYRVSAPVDEICEIVIGDERMEVVKEFKYLGTVLSKHGEIEGLVRERSVKGMSVIGSLARVMRGRNVYMEVRRGLRNSILLPSLTYRSEMQPRVRAVEISYLRGACGVARWDGESNESVCERFGMASHVNDLE